MENPCEILSLFNFITLSESSCLRRKEKREKERVLFIWCSGETIPLFKKMVQIQKKVLRYVYVLIFQRLSITYSNEHLLNIMFLNVFVIMSILCNMRIHIYYSYFTYKTLYLKY